MDKRKNHPFEIVSSQRGEGEWAVIVVLAVIGLAVYGGKRLLLESSFSGSDKPHALTADGQFYVSCKGRPSIKKEGTLFSSSDSFEVTFIDASGLRHSLNGIRKVETSELPAMVDASMPYPLPTVDGTDRNGKPYTEGNFYTWSDGSKAQIKNGKWIAVKVPNTLCNAQ